MVDNSYIRLTHWAAQHGMHRMMAGRHYKAGTLSPELQPRRQERMTPYQQTRFVMKLHGVVKGKTIELATDPELPEGQAVLVELEIPTPEFNADPLSDRDLENSIATDPDFEDIRQARALRETIAARLGGSLLNSVDLTREDRSR